MSERIQLEPIAFINEIQMIMVKNNMIGYFEISDNAKKSFGANIAKWITVEGRMTDEQRNQAVKQTMSFILGYYWGRLNKHEAR